MLMDLGVSSMQVGAAPGRLCCVVLLAVAGDMARGGEGLQGGLQGGLRFNRGNRTTLSCVQLVMGRPVAVTDVHGLRRRLMMANAASASWRTAPST